MTNKKEWAGFLAAAIAVVAVAVAVVWLGIADANRKYIVIHHHIGGSTDHYEAQHVLRSYNTVEFLSNGKRYILSGDITVIME